MKTKTVNYRRSMLGSMSIIPFLVALLILYFCSESPDNIPWLRIGILTGLMLCLSLLGSWISSSIRRKAEKSGKSAPQQPTSFPAWNRNTILKLLGGQLVFILLAVLTMSSIWKDGFHLGRFILYAAIGFAVIVIPVVVRLVYCKVHYGQWFNDPA